MEPWTALVDEARDRRIGRSGFEQLEARFADRREMRADALGWYLLGRLDFESERVAVERERRLQVFDRDTDVVEYRLHRRSHARPRSATCPEPASDRFNRSLAA